MRLMASSMPALEAGTRWQVSGGARHFVCREMCSAAPLPSQQQQHDAISTRSMLTMRAMTNKPKQANISTRHQQNTSIQTSFVQHVHADQLSWHPCRSIKVARSADSGLRCCLHPVLCSTAAHMCNACFASPQRVDGEVHAFPRIALTHCRVKIC